MNCVKYRTLAACLLIFQLWCSALSFAADDEFSFELDEFKKKPLEWGGYAEIKLEHFNYNTGGSSYILSQNGGDDSSLSRLTGTLQLDGSYTWNISSFYWVLMAAGQQDDIGWADYIDVYEAYGRLKPVDQITIDAGKKSYKWGKGYAWNPVGFVNRPKDPNNPEDALEGYITFETDLVKSFYGSDLQNAALTVLVVPVYDGINEDFGAIHYMNGAAKLYLLYKDTDIDFMVYGGDSRTMRYGVDFSKNLATNFEIHGELSYVTDQRKVMLTESGEITHEEHSNASGLLGLRYLSENDITTIFEYYHNGNGYSKGELERYYQLVEDGVIQLSEGEQDTLLKKASQLALAGYAKPYLGRNYLYLKVSQKDPFDILYVTPGVTAIYNVDDSSATITPEIVYTGFTNWELRLRYSTLLGSDYSEYGEKQNSSKVELRLRYFF